MELLWKFFGPKKTVKIQNKNKQNQFERGEVTSLPSNLHCVVRMRDLVIFKSNCILIGREQEWNECQTATEVCSCSVWRFRFFLSFKVRKNSSYGHDHGGTTTTRNGEREWIWTGNPQDSIANTSRWREQPGFWLLYAQEIVGWRRIRKGSTWNSSQD